MGPHLHKQSVTFQKPNKEVVVAIEVSGLGFELVKGSLNADLWELLGSLSHVVDGEVVGLQKLEVIGSQVHYRSNLEISIQ